MKVPATITANSAGRASSDYATALAEAIIGHNATVALVGLGYVGLPVLLAAARAGFPVMGVDDDPQRVAALASGRSYISDVPDDMLPSADAMRVTGDPDQLRNARVIVVAVPTPLRDGVPDLTAVRLAMANIARVMAPGTLVVLESTTYPGTTEELVLPILQTSGLESGREFFLAYSPERIDPGSSWSFADTPKIVSGVGDAAAELCELFYRQLVATTVRVPTPREAEMAKLIENTYRHVNIALVNELATVAPEIGVDIWAALDAAATKPFGYTPFWPGPGVGGHCIAIDPSYLSWKVGERLGFGIDFIEHAKEVNKRMPGHVAGRIGEALNDAGKPVKGSSVLILGVAYKPGVNDVRESPSLAVVERLARLGATIAYHDAFVPSIQVDGRELRSEALTPQTIATHDCVAILTAHPDVDYDEVVAHARLVFDARGVTRTRRASNVVLL